jgi:hypothetical protein
MGTSTLRQHRPVELDDVPVVHLREYEHLLAELPPLPLVVGGDPAPLDRHGSPVLEVATVHGAVAEHEALVELAGHVLQLLLGEEREGVPLALARFHLLEEEQIAVLLEVEPIY